MKRKIIAFFIGTAFFVGAIGLNVHSDNSDKLTIKNIEALAAHQTYHCTGHNSEYCEYADHTVSSGWGIWITLPGEPGDES